MTVPNWRKKCVEKVWWMVNRKNIIFWWVPKSPWVRLAVAVMLAWPLLLGQIQTKPVCPLIWGGVVCFGYTSANRKGCLKKTPAVTYLPDSTFGETWTDQSHEQTGQTSPQSAWNITEAERCPRKLSYSTCFVLARFLNLCCKIVTVSFGLCLMV